MSDIRTVTLDGPMIVLFDQSLWVTEDCTAIFGASRTGARPLLQVPRVGPAGEDELGPLLVEVRDGRGRVEIAGRTWDVRLGELARQQLGSQQGPVDIVGVRLSASDTAAAGKRIRQVQPLFIGSMEGGQLLEVLSELQRDPWTAEGFTQACLMALSTGFPRARFERTEPLQIAYEVDGREGVMNLHNQWEGTDGEPARVEEQIHQRLGVFRDMLQREPPNSGHVVAQVKHLRDLDPIVAMTGDDPPMVKPLVGDLWLLFAIDLPHAIAPLRKSTVEELGLDADRLEELAAANLYALHDDIRVSGVPGETWLMITCGGSYEASMLLVPEIWDFVDPLIPGERVVAIPNRDLLLVVGSEQTEVVDRLRELAAESAGEGTYPVAPELLVWRDGRWQLFDEERGPPAG